MVKRKNEGIDALLREPPPPLEDMNLIDWFASMAVLNGGCLANEAYDIAEEMVEERKRRYK
jgi:hypothetical protein